MNFLSEKYLPDSEGRIAYLREIVGGRPVAILAAGPSIKQLEDRIAELRNTNICYVGFSSFVQEKFILQQINKNLSVYMDSCGVNIPLTIKKIIDFLGRNENNIFISSFWQNRFELPGIDFNLDQFINKYNEKLLFFYLSLDRSVPNLDNPLHFNYTNSLLVLIQLTIIGKASKIVLFGADGYSEKKLEKYYYRPGDYGQCGMHKHLFHDTNNFNVLAPILIKNVYKTYGLDPIEIINCSEESTLNAFPKVSYDDAFEYFITGKKINRKLDLRVPKVSIISRYLNNPVFLRKTIENISCQSFTNYEHIIIYNEDAGKIQDIMQQFPQVRWISEKNIAGIRGEGKVISMAKGEYILQCRIGNGYLDKDWLCTCVEILENNADISLVWGLSQYMLEDGALGQIPDSHFLNNLPSQKKYFFYYWLKKKIQFPDGNLCVRKRVLEECLSSCDSKISNEFDAWITFNYNFNVLGYLPYFVPVVANYCRIRGDIAEQCLDLNLRNPMKIHRDDIEQYKKRLLAGKIVHRYRAGSGEAMAGGFRHGIFLFFDVGRYIKSKLPKVCLLAMEKALFFWKTYRWNSFNVAIIRISQRLIKTENN